MTFMLTINILKCFHIIFVTSSYNSVYRNVPIAATEKMANTK